MALLENAGGAAMQVRADTSKTPAPAVEPDPTRVPDDGEANVTPEEQAQYEQFVTNGLEVIYGDEGEGTPVRPDILNRLRESSDPLENLANTTVWLVTMLETSAEQGGGQLDDAVVMHGGKALLEELAEVAEAGAIHDYSEQELEGAWYRGLDLYRETATAEGRVDPEALKQQFGEIEQADREGRMSEVLPGVPVEGGGEMV